MTYFKDYFKTTFNVRPYFSGRMCGLKFAGTTFFYLSDFQMFLFEPHFHRISKKDTRHWISNKWRIWKTIWRIICLRMNKRHLWRTWSRDIKELCKLTYSSQEMSLPELYSTVSIFTLMTCCQTLVNCIWQSSRKMLLSVFMVLLGNNQSL